MKSQFSFHPNYLPHLFKRIQVNSSKGLETVAKFVGTKYEFITLKDGDIKVYYTVNCKVYGYYSTREKAKYFKSFEELAKFLNYRLAYESKKYANLQSYKIQPESFVTGLLSKI